MRIGLGLGKYMLGFHGHACRQVAVIIPIPSMCNPYPKGSLSLNILLLDAVDSETKRIFIP